MMEHSKGKPVTTSVPSIAIHFHANTEEIEELYHSDNESSGKPISDKGFTSASELENSPRRSYLSRIGKRSASIDASPVSIQDSSPPSDPWKFFSEIKGKITKSVEERITEIKARRQDGEGSPRKGKLSKDNKDSSSLSDSEDLSESSISKTCGILSTTEGVEMSSDDETASLEKDKKSDETPKLLPVVSNTPSTLRQRFKLLKNKNSIKDGTVNVKHLANIYEINTGIKTRSDDNTDEVESGVDALEDSNLQTQNFMNGESTANEEDIATNLASEIDNIEVSADKTVNVQCVSGTDIRNKFFEDNISRSFYAPTGFVDLRPTPARPSLFSTLYGYRHFLILLLALILYFWVQLPTYFHGFIAGSLITLAITGLFNKFLAGNRYDATGNTFRPSMMSYYNTLPILEVAAVREYQPITKFEGWMNEYPEVYDPHTYHITQTQAVYARLQGNLLRLSHTRAKIPKRAMWNEPKHKLNFTQHRIYNILNAKVSLLPEGLNKKRHWSKKYPICLTLTKDPMDFDNSFFNKDDNQGTLKLEKEDLVIEEKKTTKRKSVQLPPQIFSKLTEEEEDFDLESDISRPSTPSPLEENSDLLDEAVVVASSSEAALQEVANLVEQALEEEDQLVAEDEDVLSLPDEWGTFTPVDSPTETRLYLFGRTDREKEDWYRRLVAATHKNAQNIINESTSRATDSDQPSLCCETAVATEAEYLKFMAKFLKVRPRVVSKLFLKYPKNQPRKRGENKTVGEGIPYEEREVSPNMLWVNALMGRILFDCMRDASFSLKVKERIQRKLASIKLPYFIEELSVAELSLGNNSPVIHQCGQPTLDQRGVWIDLDITYDGVVVLILQTKLNLMKLKQPPKYEKRIVDSDHSPMFHSDVDDSAESSTDDDTPSFLPSSTNVLDTSGNPVPGLGGTSNSSKKFIKMVDRIAESKIFRAATENKYIKKAMEGVSNTDLRLKVEVKGLIGTVVLNIPSPPSDRVWLGFRPTPKLWLSAHPIVGERNISFLHVTNWIEKKLSQEFQKVLVIPNMEDLTIPGMSPKLPE